MKKALLIIAVSIIGVIFLYYLGLLITAYI